MKKNKLKALIKEAFLAEGKNTLLNENAPGFDNRKQGGPLPTLEGIKAAYEAKNGSEAVNEDRFVDASLEDLEQVVRNLAHTADMSEEEAAEMAINHIQDMFSEEELDEGVEKDYWADYTDIGMFYIGIDAKHSLSDQQLEKLGEKIVKQLYGGDVGKAYDDIVRGKKRGSHTGIKEADDYDAGALAKVGDSTTNGVVVKNTKLANGQVEVKYEGGDVQVLEKENGVWVEVDYHKASLKEAKMEKELKAIYAREREHNEFMRIANELFPEIAKEQEGGKFVNFKPLSNEQRDEVYAEYVKLNEETLPGGDTKITSDGQSLIKLLGKQTSILQKLKLINNRKELEDVLDYILTQVNPNLSLNQASVKAAAMSSIKKASATNESIITEADMIAESFRKVKR